MTTEAESRSGGQAYQEVGTLIRNVTAAVGKAVVGQDPAVRQILTSLLAGGHVMLEGVPGLGKTLIVRALSKAFDARFSRVQFTPDLMPSDVSGHTIYSPKTETFHVRKGPVFTNLLLADEINRAPAKTQAALLEVMQEHQVTIEGKAHPVEAPFMTIATQNPIDHEGTYPLPEAQLDRFLLKVIVDYPDEQVEGRIVQVAVHQNIGDTLNVAAVPTVMTLQQLMGAQKLVARLNVEERVINYAVRIARATREWAGVAIGAGSRGPIAMIRAARSNALLEGRDFVIPDDVKTVAIPALRHRIILAPELQIEGSHVDQVLEDIIGKVEAPRQ